MKTIIKIFAAVLAVTPVLVSCYSEPLLEVIPEVIPEDEGNGSEQDTTVRVITVSFDTKATRTVLGSDGFTPEFSARDVIYVANGTDHETPEVEYKNIGGKNVATISTTLSGSLKLVYPSNCVKLGHSEVIDEGTEDEKEIWVQNPNEIAGIIVPPVQTGYFKDANICMAEMEADDTKATFHNETAVFVIDVPAGAKGLEVTSLRTINPVTGQRFTTRNGSDEWATISREWNGVNKYSDSRTITIGNGSSALPDPCFVSIMVEEDDEVLLRDLNFDVQTLFFEGEVQEGGTGLFPGAGYQGGFSPYFLNKTFGTGSADSMKVRKGAIYTGVEDHLHEYVSGGNIKWSKANLGPQGDSTNVVGYFAWGETKGHELNSESNKFEPSDDNSGYSFEWGTGYFGSTLSAQQKNEFCPSGTLALGYDAAYYNWGGAWRMPTKNDQLSFVGEEGKTYSDGEYTIHVQYRGDLSFHPFGYGNGANLTGNDLDRSFFWTSTLYTNVSYAYFITLAKGEKQLSTSYTDSKTYKKVQMMYRYFGLPIRPVSGTEIL